MRREADDWLFMMRDGSRVENLIKLVNQRVLVAVMGNASQIRPGHWRADMRNSSVDGTHRASQRRYFEIVPSDGHWRCQL